MTSSLRPLRPHQVTALAGLRASLRDGHNRPILQAPTGAGKTVLAAHIVAGALAKHKRVVFSVPSIGLIDQTFERFVENGIAPEQMGIIQADHEWKRPDAPVQIATAQTLARRELPAADLVVIDEAHIRFRVYEDWMAHADWQRVPFVGLTATPWSKGLGKSFDDLIRPTSLRALIDEGYLSPFRVFAPDSPDLEGIKTVRGDYHEGQLAERMNRPVLVANIVETWLLRGQGRPTLCFATGRAHARAIHDEFERVGVPVAYVDANTPREERGEIGRQLGSGAIKVVCNIGTLTTGIDWDVRCLILARPTKSEILFTQIVGRALRTAEGKADALILDHSDTHARLGFVTGIDHDSLDDGSSKKGSDSDEKERKEPLPWECKSCHAVVPAQINTCCECGFVRKAPVRVDHVDGRLVELGSPPDRSAPATVGELIAAMGKASVYGQLLAFAYERNRSSGWAAHTYREVFGVWPRGLDRQAFVPVTQQMRSWLRSRDIRYARSKEVSLVRAEA